MSVYLLIESRDRFEAAGTGDFAALALSLARAGHRVAFFLVENGVLVARQGSRCLDLVVEHMANGHKTLWH